MCVGPKAEFSPLEPIANSSMFVLPTITAPASFRRSMTLASYGGTNVPASSSRGRPDALRADHVLDRRRDAGQRARLAARERSSAARACSSADSSVSVKKALMLPSNDLMRSYAARVSSTEETSRLRSASAASVIVR